MQFPPYKEMSFLYMRALPATEKWKFSDKEHLILLIRLTCPHRNEIALSQSYYFVVAVL